MGCGVVVVVVVVVVVGGLREPLRDRIGDVLPKGMVGCQMAQQQALPGQLVYFLY